MQHILLITSVWLQGAPLIQTLPMTTLAQCIDAAENTVAIVRSQAMSNMIGGAGDLQLSRDDKTHDWRLATGTVGREVEIGRASCRERV